MEQQQSTWDQYIQSRDKWYVSTLSDAGVHIDDILEGNWDKLQITCKTNLAEGTETLCIKDAPIGQPHKMHPTHIEQIRQANNIKPVDKV